MQGIPGTHNLICVLASHSPQLHLNMCRGNATSRPRSSGPGICSVRAHERITSMYSKALQVQPSEKETIPDSMAP